MSEIKLTYFDFDGGRGEVVRLILSMAGIEFTDIRVNFQQFGELKPDLPLGSLPTLEVDGVKYTQANSMARYFGKQAGLYPEDPWQAFLCDEVMDIIEDIGNALYSTMGLKGEELKEARIKVTKGPLTTGLKLLEKRLNSTGGMYMLGEDFSIADLKVYEILSMLTSGRIDHIPTDFPDKAAPKLAGHIKKVLNHPGVKAYYENRK